MNNIKARLICVTALTLIAAPAWANNADRAFLSQQQNKITAARAEPGMTQSGRADLDRAEAALTPLQNDFDGDDRKSEASISSRIDAIIETARAHSQTAAMKEEITQLQARGSRRLVAAEVAGAAAQRSASDAQVTAAASQAEAAKLRDELRNYKMKQTQLGATLVLSDVSFGTGSADLQAGAVERLRPLANYLDANPAVRVHIDGNTDSQGSASANQSLSERRADSVRTSLASMGVDKERIDAVGHGESMPVADNETAGGRQQNRRVEITLVGQKVPDPTAQ